MRKLVAAAKLVTVIVLSLLLSLLFVDLASRQFGTVVETYPQNATSFTLDHVATDHAQNTFDALIDYADVHSLFVVRTDEITGQTSILGTKLGVFAGRGAAYPELDFMGATILDNDDLKDLFASPSSAATLGLDLSRTDMVKDIPSFALGSKLVVEKLSYLYSQTATINGTYRITTTDPTQVQELAGLLSQASGRSVSEILNPPSGHTIDSILTLILPPIIAGALVLLLALFVVSNLFELTSLGACLSCGWTRTEFAFEKTYRWVFISLISIPLSIAFGIAASYGSIVSWGFVSFMCGAALLVILGVVVCIALACLLVFKISPTAAIRNRVSRRVLVGLLLCAYVASAIFVAAIGHLLDGPSQQIQANAQTMQQWASVSNLHILAHVSAGKAGGSVHAQSDAISKNFYNWYSSIADEPGVYLVHTSYKTKKNLDVLRGENPPFEVPDDPFLIYKTSPNYLASQHFSVDPQLIAQAHSGTRVYLLPNTMSAQEQQKVESYLRYGDAHDAGRSEDILTTFSASGDFSFSTYTPGSQLFAWNPDARAPQTVTDPVICLCVPQNMIFSESMSLWAVGLSNSYLKLTDQAVSRYATPSYLASFDLSDNTPQFVSSAAFVAGLQKTLGDTIRLFGSILVLAVVLMLAMVLGLVASYQVAYREEVAAKRLMGHSLWSLYKLPFVVVGVVFCAGLAAVIALSSKLGIVLMVVVLVMQLALLFGYAKSNEAKHINRELKE